MGHSQLSLERLRRRCREAQEGCWRIGRSSFSFQVDEESVTGQAGIPRCQAAAEPSAHVVSHLMS